MEYTVYSMKTREKITSFTQLAAWQESQSLALVIYQVTKKFPKTEVHGLTGQLRRAAISVPSNIAEGFARKTRGDKVQFYQIAAGSLSEVRSQILLAEGLGYIDESICKEVDSSVEHCRILIHGLIKSAEDWKHA